MTIELDTSVNAASRRARGACSNVSGRFDAERGAVDDGWAGDMDPLRPIRTEVRDEVARSIISYNTSPDLPFDRSINPYRGCEHGCIYCFARPSHAYLGLSPGLDFETRLIARPNAAELLRNELGKRGYHVRPLAIGTNTDPYQPVEKEREIMRSCLKVLAECAHPVAIVTKGSLIERDIDILQKMAALGLVRVGLSVTTLDAALSRRMEPRVPTPARRIETIRRLSSAGIPVRVMVSPIIPGLTDHELERILEAATDAGAEAASWIMLRLPREVAPLFREWLAEHVPERAAKVMARVREMHGGKDYDPQWGHRMRGRGQFATLTSQRFRKACARLGLQQASLPLRCDLFRKPSGDPRQLSFL